MAFLKVTLGVIAPPREAIRVNMVLMVTFPKRDIFFQILDRLMSSFFIFLKKLEAYHAIFILTIK